MKKVYERLYRWAEGNSEVALVLYYVFMVLTILLSVYVTFLILFHRFTIEGC